MVYIKKVSLMGYIGKRVVSLVHVVHEKFNFFIGQTELNFGMVFDIVVKMTIDIKKDFELYGVSIEEYASIHGLDLEYVRRAIGYNKNGVSGEKRRIKQNAIELSQQGYDYEYIVKALGTSEAYLKNFLPKKDNTKIRRECALLRDQGLTFAQVAENLGISIGSVQNYLRMNKKNLILRQDLSTGHLMYFVSLSHVIKYMPVLTRKVLKQALDGKEACHGYLFKRVSDIPFGIDWTIDIAE